MQKYVEAALWVFQHERPQKLEYMPHIHTPIQYGKHVQHEIQEDLILILHASIGWYNSKSLEQSMGTTIYTNKNNSTGHTSIKHYNVCVRQYQFFSI